MFSTAQFLESLVAAGFVLQGFSESYPLRLFKHFSLVAKKLVPDNQSLQSVAQTDGAG
jgi:hypothetical protein